jgi:hypothetical protein
VFLLLAILAVAGGAAPPEVIRIHLPAGKVATWFPEGTALRVIPTGEFDSLLEAARRGAQSRSTPAGPRLVRAQHRVRWEHGMLVGVSELVAEPSPSGASYLEIAPWTPMIVGRGPAAQAVGALASGQQVLWLGPSSASSGDRPAEISLDWKLRALPGTDDRSFVLGLPGNETSVLALELPTGWVPLGPRGNRQGPVRAGREGFHTWQFFGPPGQFTLRLVRPGDQGLQHESLVWVSGPTEIRLGPATGGSPAGASGESLANWRTDWLVESSGQGPVRFSARLDPGLELLDVRGEDVREFRVERQGPGALVRVTLDGQSRRPAAVGFHARARVPIEGAWSVPAIAPVDAVWTGGITTLIRDPLHIIRECRERAGVRMPARAPAGAGPGTGAEALVFEARSPESVAELVFRQPRAERNCHVRGMLRLDAQAPPEFECRLGGPGAIGLSGEVQLELPPTWVPERVALGGPDEPLSWHATVQPGGSTRLRVLIPGSEKAQDSRTLIVVARTIAGGGGGTVVLPRVKPLGFMVPDETWVARVDPALALNPVRAAGLAWLDRVPAESLAGMRQGSGLKTALAWRWIDASGSAVVECEPLDRGPRAEIRTRAILTADGQGLLLEGEILVQPGAGGLARLPVSLGGETRDLARWTFRMASGGPAIPATPLDREVRAALGFRGEDTACELSLPAEPREGRQRILFRAKLPWRRQGRVPLVSVPKSYLPRGVVLIEAPPQIHSQAAGAGLRRIVPALADDLVASWRSDRAEAGDVTDVPAAARPAHAFTYTDPDAELTLRTEALSPAGAPALVREALLTTLVDPHGRSFNRLRLLVQGEASLPLVLRMPDGATVLRALVDGLVSTPTREGARLVIPLSRSGGARSWTIDLEFERTGPTPTAGTELRPLVPSSDLPCLAFTWELITPPRWHAAASGGGLKACEPPVLESWPLGTLGLAGPIRRAPAEAVRQPDHETLRRLDASLASINAEEFTFAKWFLRWDSPALPLLIDRLSLSAMGYGPRSACLPVRAGQPGESASLRSLRQYGLALVPIDSALLLTSQEEAARVGSAEDWRPAIEEAQLWGSDRADRFQAAARWCGEATPREASSGGSAESLRPPPGWSSWKFTRAGWPGPEDRAVLEDVRARAMAGLVIAAAVLVGLIWRRGRTPRRALLLPLAGIALAIVLRLWLGDRLASPSAGLLVGSALGLLFRLGAQLAGRQPRDPGTRSSRSSLRPMPTRSLLVRATILVPLVILTGHEPAAARRGSEGPPQRDPRIPVLLPYEGAYNPSLSPRQVVLRQSDYGMLQDLARPRAPAGPLPLILAESAHEISWTEDGQAVITSDLLLRAATPEPASWSVPIARSREISATIDGRQVPVFIEGGGETARIAVPGNGPHRLRVRRLASRARVGPLQTLSLAVNPEASAQLSVQHPVGKQRLSAVNARGDVTVASGRPVTAELGPVDRVELTWGDPDLPAPAKEPAAAFVENLQLWDIEPAGDLLRARLTYRGSRRLSVLRFQTDPGLLPRKLGVPGLVAATREGPADHPVWTLRMDPPLAQPAVIELEMWRSLPASPEPAAGKAAWGRQSGDLARRLPRLEPLDVDRGPALLGVRRPGHWTGRLEPIPSIQPLSDENFVATWGALPDDRLTLSGTTRFGPADAPEFRTGPAVPRLKVRPELQLAMSAGRVDVEFDAELADPGGSPDQLTVEVPGELVVQSVSCDGLTDWDRVDGKRVRLRFDQPVVRSTRRLRLSGYIPVVTEPLRPGVQMHRMATPWLLVAGMDQSQGTLSVRSNTGVELDSAPGLTLLPSVPLPASAPVGSAKDAPVRRTYRVVDPGGLGWLRWNSAPPNVGVYIESQLTLYADAAEWTVVLNYDILGGSLDSFALKLPTAWALKAQVEFDGGKYERKSGAIGPLTFWQIFPHRPAWGSRRLVLRSAIPLVRGQEIQHPEASPLGWGGVDTYVSLVTATGSAATTAGSSSLKEVIDAGRFRDAEFWHPPGAPMRVYHVARENWTLRAQLPAVAEEAQGQAADSARVAAADLSLTILPDRSVMARGLYETQARSGRFLVAYPPGSARLLWATVDQSPIRVLMAADGRWLIPLADEGPHRVGLYWEGAPGGSGAGPPGTHESLLELPRVGPGRVPSLVTIRAPEELVIRPTLTDLEPVSFDRLELERADRTARQINEFQAQIDRRSSRDRERIGALVIAHELAIRAADRSLRLAARKGDRGRRHRAERDLEVIRSARKALLEGLRAAMLEEEVDAALGYLGQAPAGDRSSTLAVVAPPSPDPIRGLGQLSCLIGVSSGLEDEPTRLSIMANAEPAVGEVSPERARATILLGLLGALGIVAALRPGRISTALLLLASTLGLLASLGGVLVPAGGALALGAGWLFTDPPRPRAVSAPGAD